MKYFRLEHSEATFTKDAGMLNIVFDDYTKDDATLDSRNEYMSLDYTLYLTLYLEVDNSEVSGTFHFAVPVTFEIDHYAKNLKYNLAFLDDDNELYNSLKIESQGGMDHRGAQEYLVDCLLDYRSNIEQFIHEIFKPARDLEVDHCKYCGYYVNSRDMYASNICEACYSKGD